MQRAEPYSSQKQTFSRSSGDKVKQMDFGHVMSFENDSDDDIFQGRSKYFFGNALVLKRITKVKFLHEKLSCNFSKLEAGIGNINLRNRTKQVHYGQKEKTKPSPARQPSYANDKQLYKPAMLNVNGRKYTNVQHAKCDSDEDPSEKIFNAMHRQLDPNWN